MLRSYNGWTNDGTLIERSKLSNQRYTSTHKKGGWSESMWRKEIVDHPTSSSTLFHAIHSTFRSLHPAQLFRKAKRCVPSFSLLPFRLSFNRFLLFLMKTLPFFFLPLKLSMIVRRVRSDLKKVYILKIRTMNYYC